MREENFVQKRLEQVFFPEEVNEKGKKKKEVPRTRRNLIENLLQKEDIKLKIESLEKLLRHMEKPQTSSKVKAAEQEKSFVL